MELVRRARKEGTTKGGLSNTSTNFTHTLSYKASLKGSHETKNKPKNYIKVFKMIYKIIKLLKLRSKKTRLNCEQGSITI